MKIVIFAGGHGTRLWPISRHNFPKQFAQIFNGKSTLQLAVERVQDIFGIDNIYISTNAHFENIIKEQVPQILNDNLILEPEKRDVAPAIGYVTMKLQNDGYSGPMAILWADHIMERTEEFVNALALGEELINENKERFVFLGEKPRFANHNLGWITGGDKIDRRHGLKIMKFEKWKYKPELQEAETMFESGKCYWNPGYFITSTDFVIGLYKTHQSKMYTDLNKIFAPKGNLKKIYPTLDAISFDDAILANTKPEEAVVIEVDMGWSDPGTLYAMKEALSQNQDDNVIKGQVFDLESKDTLIYNDEEGKLVSTIGLEGMIVVNLKDTLLILHKDNAHKVKDLVDSLKIKGYEEYT